MIRKPNKKTKIIATLGPSTYNSKIIKSLIINGVNVFRLNFSHGTYKEHSLLIDNINKASKQLKLYPCILADLQGPKIRTGNTINNEMINITKNKEITITTKNVPSTDSIVSIQYPNLIDELSISQDIYIDDGRIHLKVRNIDKKMGEIICMVQKGGCLLSRKGVNMPNASLSIPPLTKKDKLDLQFILKQNVQFIAFSFLRKASDLLPLKDAIKKSGKDIKIIAKIETPEAVKNIDEILDNCDGIMVARGDLGVEVSLEKVTIMQKDLITKANNKAKLVIVATEMLQSMIDSSRPTRAEASDVANAILDGADCVMLSGETSIGKFPVEAVKAMSDIAAEIENSAYYPKKFIDLTLPDHSFSHTVAEAAAHSSQDQGNIPVLVFTLSGKTAFYLSKIRNQGPIIAFSPDTQIVSILRASWNIESFYLPFNKDTLKLQKAAESILIKEKLVKKNSKVAVILGTKSIQGATDSLRLKRIGEE